MVYEHESSVTTRCNPLYKYKFQIRGFRNSSFSQWKNTERKFFAIWLLTTRTVGNKFEYKESVTESHVPNVRSGIKQINTFTIWGNSP